MKEFWRRLFVAHCQSRNRRFPPAFLSQISLISIPNFKIPKFHEQFNCHIVLNFHVQGSNQLKFATQPKTNNNNNGN